MGQYHPALLAWLGWPSGVKEHGRNEGLSRNLGVPDISILHRDRIRGAGQKCPWPVEPARGETGAKATNEGERKGRYCQTKATKCGGTDVRASDWLKTPENRIQSKLKLARGDGSYLKVLDKLARCHLLVLDDWALLPMEGQAQHDLLEVIDDRTGARSTIVTSQVPIAKWHDLVGDPSVADALLDRLVGTAIKIELKGASLRRA